MITFDQFKDKTRYNSTTIVEAKSHIPSDVFTIQKNWREFLTAADTVCSPIFKEIYNSHEKKNLIDHMTGYGFESKPGYLKVYIVDFDKFLKTGKSTPLIVDHKKIKAIAKRLIRYVPYNLSKSDYRRKFFGFYDFDTIVSIADDILSQSAINNMSYNSFIPLIKGIKGITKIDNAKLNTTYKLIADAPYYDEQMVCGGSGEFMHCYVKQTLTPDLSFVFTTFETIELSEDGITFNNVNISK